MRNPLHKKQEVEILQNKSDIEKKRNKANALTDIKILFDCHKQGEFRFE